MVRKQWLWMVLVLPILLVAGMATPAFSEPTLKMVSVDVESRGAVRKLAAMGLDIGAVKRSSLVRNEKGEMVQTYRVELVVSALDEIKLMKTGLKWTPIEPAAQPKALRATPTETVYHSFDEPKLGIKDQLYAIAKAYPDLTHMETIGYSIQGRPLLAMRLTENDDDEDELDDDNGKPQVLYVATHHAREWVATQMAMRLIKYLTTNYGSNKRVSDLLEETEIWVIPVANPDGYEYTFTDGNRLWRKNLRDNDGDGQITVADGVDLNRNFNSHWGLDDEGSSGNPFDGTYRGEAPESEPETVALVNFMARHSFKFAISYHTYSNLILYPLGWQNQTTSFDDPVFVAQAGTDDYPAIYDSLRDEGYDPGVGADLYITNGDFTDWAYSVAHVPSHTLEFTDGYDFRFPDNEAMVQTVFEDSLEFVLSVAESAQDPGRPKSPVGMPAEDIYHAPVTQSFGANQTIEVLARHDSEPEVFFQINGGSWNELDMEESLGRFFNENPGLFYTRYVAQISGQQEGDTVAYRVETDDTQIGPFNYDVPKASGNPVLIVAAEDYSGSDPTYTDPTQPNYLHYYTEALDAAGYAYDVWDVDKQGAPSAIEALSHYKTTIWYTGDDFAPSVPDGLAMHEQEFLAFRAYMNYWNGKLFASGQDLAHPSTFEGDFSDDFFQYYLGAHMDIDSGGIDNTTGLPYDVLGIDGDPLFDGLAFGLHGGDGANNQWRASSFRATSDVLPAFPDVLAANYDQRVGPFDPWSGLYYLYSQQSNRSFKRLGRTLTLPTGAPQLRFWISYDIERDWDYAFVEIREAGTDNWTTLPEINGLTAQGTGQSCSNGWVDRIHPHLAHYMDGDCNPAGTTGQWHAFTGSNGGWQQVAFDLSAYAGQTVEIYISYASDWGTQNFGFFVDDLELTGDPLVDFEAGLGAWAVSFTPGSNAQNNWDAITGIGFPQGPAIRTPDTVYLGFGFEAIDNEESRATLMDRVIRYLLPTP